MQSATHVGDEPGPSQDAPVPISALAAAAPEALPSKSPQPARSAAATQQGISAAGESAPDHVDSTTPARSDAFVEQGHNTCNTGKARLLLKVQTCDLNRLDTRQALVHPPGEPSAAASADEPCGAESASSAGERTIETPQQTGDLLRITTEDEKSRAIIRHSEALAEATRKQADADEAHDEAVRLKEDAANAEQEAARKLADANKAADYVRAMAAAIAAAELAAAESAQKAASVLAEARRARAAARPPDLDLRVVEEDPFDLHRPLAAATPRRSLDEYQHPWGAAKTPRGLATTPHGRSLMTPRRATLLGAGLITPRGGRRRASVSLLSMDVTMMASSACNKPAFETDAHTLMIDALHARVRRLEMQMKVSCMPVACQRSFMLVNAEAHAA